MDLALTFRKKNKNVDQALFEKKNCGKIGGDLGLWRERTSFLNYLDINNSPY